MPNCEVKLMMGNHAVAHGALESGVAVASGYPGTPSSEIIEYLLEHGVEVGMYVEWSTNEKVAFEVAYGAALAGSRSLTAMKHVGLNVAMDPLMSSAYTGVRAGFLVVTADDPGMWSSQNEQDNRWVGLHARIPVFEPYSPQDAKNMVKLAISFSERFGHPVIMRLVTRISHSREPVEVCEPIRPRFSSHYDKDPLHHALIPANARALKAELVRRWRLIEEAVNDLPSIVNGEGDVLVLTSGIAYRYASEALRMMEAKARILNIATPVPAPRKVIANAASSASKVIVVEEGDPVLEMQVKALMYDEGLKVPIYGKEEGLFGDVSELTLDSVMAGLAKALDIPYKAPAPPQTPAPPRPPVFCPGCPHMASFYELKIASAKAKVKPVYSGDIGCYSLGINPPFREQDVLTNMGSSIGVGMGIYRGTGGREFIVAVIGDSTFFHVGIPALVNAVYNKTPMLIVVLDNRYTAMTGGQPNPTQRIDIAKVAEAIGADEVYVIDPFDVKAAEEAMVKAMEGVRLGHVVVVVSRRACALEAARAYRRLVARFRVIEDKCRACGICYNLLSCPALSKDERGIAKIDPYSCVGCSVCAQACPFNAIVPMGDTETWLRAWGRM